MLHLILRNRFVFLLSLLSIWVLIFTVPYIGKYIRNAGTDAMTSKRSGRRNVNRFQKKPEDAVDYIHAGSFFQDNLCLDSIDSKAGGSIGLWSCHNEGKNQFWFILKDGLLKNKDLCVEGPTNLNTFGGNPSLQVCDSEKEQQDWRYKDGHISLSGSELCLEADTKNKQVKMTVCNEEKTQQKWKLKVPEGL